MPEEINYTELLEQEYGNEGSIYLVQELREMERMPDEEIYHLLESFF